MEHLELGQQLSAAATARHWVCERCPAEHLPSRRRWIAQLLTHELVVNAVEHGSGPVVLCLTHDEEGIVVAISDRGARLPALRTQLPDATAGHGIALVDALATTWGVYRNRVAEPSGAIAGLVTTAATGAGSVAGAELAEHCGAPGRGWPQPDLDDTAVATAGKTVWFHLATS